MCYYFQSSRVNWFFSKGRDSQESCAGDLCLLLSNRGASYLRRGWEGDIYACLLDTIRALKLDPDNIKAHYRIVKSLYELKQYEMAGEMLQLFKVFVLSDFDHNLIMAGIVLY